MTGGWHPLTIRAIAYQALLRVVHCVERVFNVRLY